jgi:cell wall-associated NlpC family hydrolase
MNTIKNLLVSFLLIELMVLLGVISLKSYDVFDVMNSNLRTITAKNHYRDKESTLLSIVQEVDAIKGLLDMQFGNQLYTVHSKKVTKKLAFRDRVYLQSRYVSSSINKIEEEVKVMAKKEIETTAKKELGKRYVWGATGPKTFDCSGFTMKVFRKAGINLPRVSRSQAKVGAKVAFNELQRGDMVFFDTEKHRTGRVNHVGIYLEDGKFIHASSGNKKVVITSFDKKKFYKNRFLWGRRVIKEKMNYAFDSLSSMDIHTLIDGQSAMNILSNKISIETLLGLKDFSFDDMKKRVMASL